MDNDLFDEIRLFVCELMLQLILKIVPKRTIEGKKLIYYIKIYFKGILLQGFSEYLNKDLKNEL